VELNVFEVIRAADVFLFRFKCPECDETLMTGEAPGKCFSCSADLSRAVLKLERSDKRVLCGSWRKPKGGLTKKKIQALYSMQEGYCAYCDSDLRTVEYHVDHVLPLAAGGTNDVRNLVLACPCCNLRASSFIFRDYLAKRAYLQELRKRDI
jgi:5-methylcytosine-specific restriction endonuclease McrA